MRSKTSWSRCCRWAATLIALTATTVAAEPPEMPDGWSDGYLYANGVRLHYYRATPAPEKPDIVMVHGVTDNGLCWTTLTEEFQDAYNIHMLDTRGHGLSDPFTPADDGDTLIKDVVAAVEALGLEKPILIGHSMGAATVMRIGAEYPDLARAVVMIDPFLQAPQADPSRARDGEGKRRRDSPPRPSGNAGRDAEPDRNRLSINMAGTPEILVAQNNYRFEDLVATGRRQFPKWSDADVQYWALSKKQYHGAYSADAWQAMSGSMRIGDALARIPVPALILKADASPERRQTEQAAIEGLEQVKQVHVEGGGHNLHHDELQDRKSVV